MVWTRRSAKKGRNKSSLILIIPTTGMVSGQLFKFTNTAEIRRCERRGRFERRLRRCYGWKSVEWDRRMYRIVGRWMNTRTFRVVRRRQQWSTRKKILRYFVQVVTFEMDSQWFSEGEVFIRLETACSVFDVFGCYQGTCVGVRGGGLMYELKWRVFSFILFLFVYGYGHSNEVDD